MSNSNSSRSEITAKTIRGLTLPECRTLIRAHRGVDRLPKTPSTVAHAIRIILEERTSVDWDWVAAANLDPDRIGCGATSSNLVDTVVLNLVQRSRILIPEKIATAPTQAVLEGSDGKKKTVDDGMSDLSDLSDNENLRNTDTAITASCKAKSNGSVSDLNASNDSKPVQLLVWDLRDEDNIIKRVVPDEVLNSSTVDGVACVGAIAVFDVWYASGGYNTDNGPMLLSTGFPAWPDVRIRLTQRDASSGAFDELVQDKVPIVNDDGKWIVLLIMEKMVQSKSNEALQKKPLLEARSRAPTTSRSKELTTKTVDKNTGVVAWLVRKYETDDVVLAIRLEPQVKKDQEISKLRVWIQKVAAVVRENKKTGFDAVEGAQYKTITRGNIGGLFNRGAEWVKHCEEADLLMEEKGDANDEIREHLIGLGHTTFGVASFLKYLRSIDSE